AAVQAVDAQGMVIPFKEPYQIEACVRASLAKLVEINLAEGVISPPGSDQRSAQEVRAADGKGLCRSIVFPLFGTGQGGVLASEVILPMLDGITGYLADEGQSIAESSLSEIYLSAFTEEDAGQTIAALRSALL